MISRPRANHFLFLQKVSNDRYISNMDHFVLIGIVLKNLIGMQP